MTLEHFQRRKPGSPHSRLKLVPSGEPNAAGQRAARQEWVNLSAEEAAAYDAKWQAHWEGLTAAQLAKRNERNLWHRARRHFPAEASA